MTFKPGQSGNPAGRPKLLDALRDFRTARQAFMAKTGWPALEEMAKDAESPHRYRAIELICAYAYGRPTQPLSGDLDPDTPPLVVTISFDRNADEDQPSPA